MKSLYTLIIAILLSLNFSSQNLISTIREVPYENSWLSGNMDEYSYDSSGNLTEHIKSVSPLFETFWTLDSRILYTYEQINNVASTSWQLWDVNSGDWANDHKSFYEYNANGEISSRLNYFYEDNAINDSTITTTTYDSEFRIMTIVSEITLDNSQMWSTSSQSNYTYTADGDSTYRITQLYNQSQFVNSSRQITSMNNTTETILNQSWENEQWTNVNRTINEYDENDLLITISKQFWSNQQWTNLNKISNVYNDSNSLITSHQEYWDSSQSEFANSYFRTFTYNLDGTEHQIHKDSWLNEEDGWENTERKTNTYEIIDGIDPEEIISNNILLYPNPTIDIIKVAGLPHGKFDLVVIDVAGRKIISETTVDSEDNSISLEHLKPGLYYIKLSQGNTLINQQIIKE